MFIYADMQDFGTNIYTSPKGYVRKTVKPSQTKLVSELKEHALNVCRNKISEKYINKLLNPFSNNFSNGYVYLLDDKIIGFIVWSVKKDTSIRKSSTPIEEDYSFCTPSKYLYIHLVCATETGTTFGYRMLDDVENYCIDNTIPVIVLEAINEPMTKYYEKNGFTLLNELPLTDELKLKYGYKIIMRKPIVQLLRQSHKNFRTSKTRRLGQQTPNLPIQDRIVIEKLIDERNNANTSNYNMSLIN